MGYRDGQTPPDKPGVVSGVATRGAFSFGISDTGVQVLLCAAGMDSSD